MLDGIKIDLDLNEVSLYVEIYIFALIFSLFSLIYNTSFINYGFITFVYGVTAQIFQLAFDNKTKNNWLLFLSQFILLIAWVYAIIKF
jgi:uncharacterized membrane protein HdeD (DUF308 family)